MKKILKFTGYLIGGLIILLVAAVIILKLIPDDKYKDWINTAAQSATGRDLSMDTLELDFGTALRVRADNIRMANADWSKEKDMLSIKRLEADFGLLPLLSGKAEVRAVVEKANMLTENNAEGVSNWAMGSGEAVKEVEQPDVDDDEFTGLPIHPVIHEIRIDDFKLTQLASPDAEPKVISLKQFLIETPEKDTTLNLSADVDGRPVTLTGNLGDMQQFIDKTSQPVQINGDINGNTLKVAGKWGPLFPKQVMLIDVNVNIPATEKLAALAGLEVEEFEDINISGKLVGDGKTFALDPFIVNLDDPNAKLSIQGSIADLGHMSGIKITTDANTESLETLLKQLGIDLPTALPPEIVVSGHVDGGLKDLALSELIIEARDEGVDIKATTTIGDLLNVNKVNVNVVGTIDSLSKLSAYAQTELPETDPINLNITLKENESTKPAFTVHADTGGANFDITGELEDLSVPDQLELDVAIKAASMAALNKLAQIEFADQGPLDVTTKVILQGKNISVNDLKLALADQSATGNLTLVLPEEETQPMAVNGKLNIAYLNLDALLPEPVEPAEGEAAAATAAEPAPEPEVAESTDTGAESERLFSNEPFLRDKLHAYNVDFAVTANEIKFGKSDMKDVQLTVNLKDGLLKVEPIKATGGAGNIDGVISLDGQTETAKLDIDLGILKMPMPNIGGAVDFDVDIKGQGKSVAELMGSMNGQMLLVARDGKIEQSIASKFGTGLLSFSEEKDYTDLECAILRVDIKDGIADFDNKLAAQLTEVTWKGGGEINLKTEELEAGIRPKPRKGIPISAGNLASLMYVGGTLKNPKVQLDPKDVAVKYAKYSAAIATGGLTFVAEAIKNKMQANQDVCELILEGTVFEELDKESKDADEQFEKEQQKAAKEKK